MQVIGRRSKFLFNGPLIGSLLLAILFAILDLNYQALATSDSFDFVKETNLLCKDKQSVNLSRISQLKLIIDYLKLSSNKDSVEGCEKYRDSILDLEETIIDNVENVCNDKKVRLIRDYHEKYISAPASKGEISMDTRKAQIPQRIKEFFLAYALKVDYICKKNMINSLLQDTQSLLNERDLNLFNTWSRSSNSVMSSIVGSPSDYDDLILIGNLNYLKSSSNNPGASNEKLFIQTKTGRLIRKIQLACRRRFKPIYESLIIPLVNLSNLGYNYQGEDLKIELAEMRSNERINQWYRMVYLCELLNEIELIEDTDDDQVNSSSSDQRVVSILTKDEAEAITKNQQSSNRRLADFGRPEIAPSNKSGPNDGEDDFEQLIYENSDNLIPIEDLIMDQNDRDFIKLINNFDSTRKEADRIRSKIMIKMKGFAMKMLKNNKIKIVSKLFTKHENHEEGHNPQVDAVQAIDEFLSTSDNQAANSLDLPVAGLKDYMKRVHQNTYVKYRGGVSPSKNNTSSLINWPKIFSFVLASLLLIIGILMLAAVVG